MVPVIVAAGEKIPCGMTATFPVMSSTAIVSPMALPIPRIMDEKIPDFAAGRITFVIVSRLSAPSAYDASLYAFGTDSIEFTDMLTIVGNIIIARIMAPASTDSPVAPASGATAPARPLTMTKVYTEKPDLILLDIMLPKKDGYEICRELRSEGNNVPIIMLTAKAEEVDKVLGLEFGADDYIAKPFGVRELIARIKAVLRRYEISETESGDTDEVFSSGGLTINYDRHEITLDGRQIDLTYKEFELLGFLAKNRGHDKAPGSSPRRHFLPVQFPFPRTCCHMRRRHTPGFLHRCSHRKMFL